MSNASEPSTVNGGPVNRRNRGVSKRAMIIAGGLLVIFAGIGLAWYLWQRESNSSDKKIDPRISYSQEAKTELEQYGDDQAAKLDNPKEKSAFYLDRFYVKVQAEDYQGALDDFNEAAKSKDFAPGYSAYLILYDVHKKLGNEADAQKALDTAQTMAKNISDEQLREDAMVEIQQKRDQ